MPVWVPFLWSFTSPEGLIINPAVIQYISIARTWLKILRVPVQLNAMLNMEMDKLFSVSNSILAIITYYLWYKGPVNYCWQKKVHKRNHFESCMWQTQSNRKLETDMMLLEKDVPRSVCTNPVVKICWLFSEIYECRYQWELHVQWIVWNN